jgi:hypothetical protein
MDNFPKNFFENGVGTGKGVKFINNVLPGRDCSPTLKGGD